MQALKSAYKSAKTTLGIESYKSVLASLVDVYNHVIAGYKRAKEQAQLNEAELSLYKVAGVRTEGRDLREISEQEVNEALASLDTKDTEKYMYLKTLIDGLNALMKEEYARSANIETRKKNLNTYSTGTSNTTQEAKKYVGYVIQKLQKAERNRQAKISGKLNILMGKASAPAPTLGPSRQNLLFLQQVDLYGLGGMTYEEQMIQLEDIRKRVRAAEQGILGKDPNFLRGVSPQVRKLREDAIVAYFIAENLDQKQRIIADLLKAEVALREAGYARAAAAATSTSTSTGPRRNIGAGTGLSLGGKRKTRKAARKSRKTRRN